MGMGIRTQGERLLRPLYDNERILKSLRLCRTGHVWDRREQGMPTKFWLRNVWKTEGYLKIISKFILKKWVLKM
jgi:hypothetical protein